VDEGLGRTYAKDEIVVRQGDVGACMYVVQAGRVEVVSESDGRETRLCELGPGDIFGEMAIFEREVRSATVRTLEPARILTVDRRTFMRRVQEDPSLALNLLESLSHRVRRLDAEVVEMRARLTRGSA
jgi:CRP-like cAMP-binding protein